jgi:hypothetical protein
MIKIAISKIRPTTVLVSAASAGRRVVSFVGVVPDPVVSDHIEGAVKAGHAIGFSVFEIEGSACRGDLPARNVEVHHLGHDYAVRIGLLFRQA